MLCIECKKNHGKWLSTCGDMVKDVLGGSCVNTAAGLLDRGSAVSIVLPGLWRSTKLNRVR